MYINKFDLKKKDQYIKISIIYIKKIKIKTWELK